MIADLKPYDVAIVGGGASGTLTALNLIALSSETLRLGLWDSGGRFGQGVAYSTVDPEHFLNVPARSMSAWVDEPLHFLEWLRVSGRPESRESDFVPRERYGAYLQTLIRERSRQLPAGSALDRYGEAMGEIESTSEGIEGHFVSGGRWQARALVLATGNPLPADLRIPDHGVYGSAAYRRSPWSAGALDALPADAPLLLLGAGLTAVDVVVSLRSRGHRGPIHTLSRHGFWPRPHLPYSPLSDGWKPPLGTTLRQLLREVRKRIAEARTGEDWRAVIDALRPLSPQLWRGLSLADQRRFMRHLRAHWDVHRHRVAPTPGQAVAKWQEEGSLQTHSGRLLELQPEGDGVVASYRPRGGPAPRSLRVARVINCTGPATLASGTTEPLRGLLQRGEAVLDPHAQGLRANAFGALINAEGRASERLFTLGPLRRGELWETTAVPEIRVQARDLAIQLLATRT